MGQTIDWKNVIKLSGAYMAYLIGSGFATGQEVMQFFASYGKAGIAGIVLSAILFCSLGVTLMTRGFELQLKQPGDIFKLYCGKIIGRLIEYFTLLFLFSIVVIMISGTGAIAHEHFGIPTYIGLIGMGVITMLTVIFGLKKLVDIIGAVGPVIVVLTIAICLVVFFKNINGLPSLDTLPQAAKDLQPAGHWWQASILFFCYNILAGTIFFTQLGQQAGSRKEAAAAGICGGAGLMLAVLAMVVAMFAHYPNVLKLEVPVLYLGDTISPIVAMIFSICILLGIYSTTAPMYWLVKNEFMRFIPAKFGLIVTVVLGVVFMLGGTLPFGKLVAMIYPFVGYIGLAMVIVIFARTIWSKVKPQSNNI
ncbi:hypothetical protein MUA90_11925 [Staphylococcus sp. IVB6181]|uniref:YkvI family membrane protein n=1 Tax=Staphylococcus TaxID=1279 RepID=UPI000D0395C0|nr:MULTISPECIES: hypothetical protein [Staphylococcus]MCD8914049.1 hypothetical protein [Staphylococcus simulans]UXV34706.1 hypothetical protein MUA90_11925 [Staphylococcus sp. IVB6181]